MQALRSGFCSERQSRALAGRTAPVDPHCFFPLAYWWRFLCAPSPPAAGAPAAAATPTTAAPTRGVPGGARGPADVAGSVAAVTAPAPCAPCAPAPSARPPPPPCCAPVPGIELIAWARRAAWMAASHDSAPARGGGGPTGTDEEEEAGAGEARSLA
ncbi:unnamed protein product [Lampetra fluviatilis]